MDEIKPNSHKYKDELAESPAVRKKVTALAENQMRKKSFMRKFMDIFIPSDIENVGEYLFHTIVLPSFKRMIMQSMDTLLYGKSGSKERTSTTRDRASYTQYYRDSRPSAPTSTGRIFHWDDITFRTFDDAQLVLDDLYADIADYGVAKISSLYDYSGRIAPWTANQWGWTSLKNVDIVELADVNGDPCWALRLPKAMPIEK